MEEADWDRASERASENKHMKEESAARRKSIPNQYGRSKEWIFSFVWYFLFCFCCCFLAVWCCSFVHGYLYNGCNILGHRIFDVLIKNQSVTKDSLGRVFFFLLNQRNHSHNQVLCITMSWAFVELVQQQFNSNWQKVDAKRLGQKKWHVKPNRMYCWGGKQPYLG